MLLPALPRRILGVCYAWTILLSAVLLFQVQPIISKAILPWFGGGPAVWTTCMVFFQVLLFAGYAYAHMSTSRLRPALQGLLHLVLLAAALAVLPILPSAGWKPADAQFPAPRILMLLCACVGLPYFVLSSTGPLLQAWFCRLPSLAEGRSPYRLYALSNAGSLLGLIGYPFLVEPLLTTSAQAACWSAGFALFGLCCGCVALRIWKPVSQGDATCDVPASGPEPADRAERPRIRQSLVWLALAGAASAMLLAVTDHVCQDVAVIPFLWVAPLSLYLLTLIICFERDGWYTPRWFGLAAAAALAGVGATRLAARPVHLLLEVAVNFAALFLLAMVCHGELARRKPAPRWLTQFYLMLAAGGALGGLLVGMVAPLLFSTHVEFKLGLIGGYVLAVAVVLGDEHCRWFRGHPRRGVVAGLALFVGLLVILRSQDSIALGPIRSVTRNFYGVLYVDEVLAEDPRRHAFALRHGRILHGLQLTADRRWPTTYYGRTSGIGLLLEDLRPRGTLRVGAVGLGVGTLAAYARQGDCLRFYEINPAVERLARQHFTYLADCPVQVAVVLGDARLSLERESPQRFDVLVLDAFSGDAIPLHLLTREAFEIYLRHLAPDGVLALHITNRHVDLNPVVAAQASAADCHQIRIRSSADNARGITASVWLLLSRDPEALATPRLKLAADPPVASPFSVPPWHDDSTNLLEVLRF
jgi:hypothetical protein